MFSLMASISSTVDKLRNLIPLYNVLVSSTQSRLLIGGGKHRIGEDGGEGMKEAIANPACR